MTDAALLFSRGRNAVRTPLLVLSLFIAAALIGPAPAFPQIREATPSMEETESQFLRIVRVLESEPSAASVGPWSCPAPEGWTGSRAELYDKAASLAEDLAASFSASQPNSILAEEYSKWAAEERSLAAVARVSCVRSLLIVTRLPREPERNSAPGTGTATRVDKEKTGFKSRSTSRSVRAANVGAGSPVVPKKNDSVPATLQSSAPDSAFATGTSNAGGIFMTGSQISGRVTDVTTATTSSFNAPVGDNARANIGGVRVFDSSVSGETNSCTTVQNMLVQAVSGSAHIGGVQIK